MSEFSTDKIGTTSKVPARRPAVKPAEKGTGLVLDDILKAICDTRAAYQLSKAGFGLAEMEGEGVARDAVDKVINATIARHGTDIYSKSDPIFKKIRSFRPRERIIRVGFCPRWRIPRAHARNVLRLVLESVLQTIVQLPNKDRRSKYGTRELKRLVLHCEKLARKFENALGEDEIRDRITAYFTGTRRPEYTQMYRLGMDLKSAAGTIRSILAQTRVIKHRRDSPNPQVRFALYAIGWFESSTGKQHYTSFKALLNSAYIAAGAYPPAWLDRLEIEMTRRRARRENWLQSILVKSKVL